ncbi:hypothetical protein MMC14_003166 [Varicellaria rhodocarpa]|nr:hypothetical protein [Varicellaria rhodocarpa]
MAQSAVAFFCDWWLASLPIVFVWNVRIDARTTIGICLLVGFGFCTGFCALARTIVVASVSDVDSARTRLDLYLLSSSETNVGLIAACIPAIRPLFQKEYLAVVRKLIQISYWSSSPSNDCLDFYVADQQHPERPHEPGLRPQRYPDASTSAPIELPVSPIYPGETQVDGKKRPQLDISPV